MRRRPAPKPALLKGQKWRNTHQATIDAILGAGVRPVRSRGTSFYNRDNWTARTFAASMCTWAELNPGKTPREWDLANWVTVGNDHKVASYHKGITIAQTPDELPKWLALALVGGGYHEAWHTKWSRLKPIHMDDVRDRVYSLFPRMPYDPSKGLYGWRGMTGALLTWSNIIEDIRIERIGCQVYPGAPNKMEALQDLILRQEEAGREAAAHRGISAGVTMGVVMGAFRDLGLGYETPRQQQALQGYQNRCPKGYQFVAEGPLKPFLDRAIALGPEDDLESLWLAMEILIAIQEESDKLPEPKPEPDTDSDSDDDGEDDDDDGEDDDDDGEEDDDDGEEDDDDGEEDDDGDLDGPDGDVGDDSEGPEGGDSPDEGDSEETEAPRMESDSQEEGEGGMSSGGDGDAIVWKVGDKAILSSGPYKGETVEVTRAGVPNSNGVQELEFKVIEPFWQQVAEEALSTVVSSLGN